MKTLRLANANHNFLSLSGSWSSALQYRPPWDIRISLSYILTILFLNIKHSRNLKKLKSYNESNAMFYSV